MKLVAFLATLLLLAPGAVSAQSSGGGLGGVLDTLGGIFGVGSGRVHGNVVVNRGDTLVVRTDAGRTLAVDASNTDARLRGLLKPGDGVTVVMRPAKEGEPRDATPVATELQLDPPTQAGKSWLTVEGTVQEATKSRVTFKTREGFTLPLDVAAITGLPTLQTGQPATLTYEQGRQGPVAVWIEPGTSAGSVSPTPVPGQQPYPQTGASPSASPDTGLQRLHGLVESVSLTGFTLTSDDGRKVTVDTLRLSEGRAPNVRPGDLVTVFGRPGANPSEVTAEFVQADR
jgi:hypothetical protein